MVFFLLFLALMIISPLGVIAQSSSENSLLRIGKELSLDGQAGWDFYDGPDAPGGAYYGKSFVANTPLHASVALGKTLPPGSYLIFLKVLDYDRYGKVSVKLGNGTAQIDTNDRDLNGYWTTPTRIEVTANTSSLDLDFLWVNGEPSPMRNMWMGLYITPTSNGQITVDRYDFLVDWRYPTAAELDNSPPVKGNLVNNSSFEVGVGNGWGLHSMPFREEAISDAWGQNVSFNVGSGSLRMTLPTNRWLQAISKPFSLKPNKKYTASVYVKSSGQDWANIILYNGYIPPSEPGFTNQQILKAGILANSTWQRISVTGILFKYPTSDFHIAFDAQRYNGGTLWFDNVQLEEGDISPYAPRTPIEVGLTTTNLGGLYYDDETPKMSLRVYNSTSSTITTNADYEITDYENKLVKSGTQLVTVPAKSTSASDFLIPTGQRGIFRARIWIRDQGDSEDEIVYSIVPRPATGGIDRTSLMGGHIDLYNRQLGLMQRLGMKWTRGLSTGQCWRWENAEPTEGNYVWYDAEVALPAQYGISIMANIGENVPPWAYRTYFALNTPTGGGFQMGETVRSSSGGTGKITTVLTTAHATGHALQLIDPTGTFTKGDIITGLTSGTTAQMRTASFPKSAALDKWDDYLQNVVSHYANSVQAWEIWNEPNQDGEEVPEPDEDPAFYAEILRRASTKIRAIAPQAQIVGMGGVLYSTWMKKVMDRLGPNATSLVDSMATHLYPPNGVVSSDLKRDITDVYNKPVWNTESGCWDLGFYSGVNANFRRQGLALVPFRYADRFYRGQVIEAERMSVNFLECIGGGISRYFYYDSRQAARPDFYNGHPTMIDFDDSIRAKGIVYSILGSFFDHSVGQGRVTLPDDNVRVYLYDKAGTPMAAIFTRDRKNKRLDLASSVTAANINLYNVMGNRIPINSTQIPCGRTPLILVGTNISVAALRTAISTGTSSARPDVLAPNLNITVGPRGNVPYGELIQLRWLAIDDQDIPAEEAPGCLLYSYKLEGRDADWSPWTQETWADYAGLPPRQFSFQVRARDSAGNMSPTSVRDFNVVSSIASPSQLRPVQ